jgi:hypothetical protein
MSGTSKIREAIVVSFYRDIIAAQGVAVVVAVCHDSPLVEVYVRQDWQPVLAYWRISSGMPDPVSETESRT